MSSKKSSWKFWERKSDKGGNAIEDLGLKIYSDRVLQYRISMIYLLHLAVEGGTLDLPTYLKDEADENEKSGTENWYLVLGFHGLRIQKTEDRIQEKVFTAEGAE